MACYTNMTTVIQLSSPNCWECINNVRAALSHMYGVTSVTVDYNTVKVIGKADPYDLLSVVKSYDMYASILWSKPTVHGYPYGSGYGYGYSGHNYYNNGYGYSGHNCYNNGYYYQPHCGYPYNSGCNIM